MKASDAKVGQMVEEADLPPSVVREGGGWVSVEIGPWRPVQVYVCRGCHKDGRYGFQVLEVRR